MAMKTSTEDLGKYFFIGVIVLAFLQFIAYFFGSLFPTIRVFQLFRIGMILYIILIFAILYVAFTLVFKSYTLNRAQFVALVIALTVIVFLLLKVKILVPQMFSIANLELERTIMSVFGK